MADPDDATVVDRWDGVKETLCFSKRAWEIYRRHRQGRLEEAHTAERAALLARWRLVQALAVPPAADLLVAEVAQRLNRPGRPPAAPQDTVSLQNRTGVDGALWYLSSFFSSASRFGLFRKQEGIEAAAQDELLGAMQRRLPPCYADLAEGLDGDSLLQREDMEQAPASQ
jgi:hypothetical protein